MANYSRSKHGSIRKLKSGKWQVRVSNGFKRDGSRNVLTGTCNTGAEAELLRMQLVVKAGKCPNFGDDMTLDDYYHGYFVPGRKDKLTKATMNDYDTHYRVHIAPYLGFRDMASIKHAEIQALVSGKTRSTAEHTVKTLRAILRDAWLNEFLDIEPMRRPVELPQQNEQRGVWSVQDVARAMDVMEGLPIEALWLLMVGAGLRREEAYALFWRDLTFNKVTTIAGDTAYHCTAVIDDAVTVADGRKDVKTAFSRRMAVVSEPFASRLHALKDAPDEPICKLSLSRVSRSWASMWKEVPKKKDGTRYKLRAGSYRGRMLDAGVPYVQMSRMRATHETIMQAVGISDTLNARLHGRSDVSKVGYKHYLAPDVDTFGAAAQALGDAVNQAKSS